MKITPISSLAGATSSKVQLVEIDGVKRVLKTATQEEMVNEELFQKHLGDAGIPNLWTQRDGLNTDQILLEYITDSQSPSSSLTVEACKKWGELMHDVHAIQKQTASKVGEDGNFIEVVWSQFIQEELSSAIERRTNKKSDLSDEVMAFLEKEVLALGEQSEAKTTWSLLHADMHSNNVLVRVDDFVPFDKGSGIFFGDPLYDIATVAMEFPGAFTPSLQKDSSLWAAFLEGYGHDMHDTNLLRYILLRSIGRYPNSFTPQLKELIGNIVTILIK